MKKFYFLGLAMLFGVVNIGHAQMLIKDAAGLKVAKDSLSKIDEYTNNININTSQINGLQLLLVGEDKETEKTETNIRTVPYGKIERDAIKIIFIPLIQALLSFSLNWHKILIRKTISYTYLLLLLLKT